MLTENGVGESAVTFAGIDGAVVSAAGPSRLVPNAASSNTTS